MGTSCGTGTRCLFSSESLQQADEDSWGVPFAAQHPQDDELAVKKLGQEDDAVWRGGCCSCSNPPKASVGNISEVQTPAASTPNGRAAALLVSAEPAEQERPSLVKTAKEAGGRASGGSAQKEDPPHYDSLSSWSKTRKTSTRLIDDVVSGISRISARKEGTPKQRKSNDTLRPPSGNVNRPQDYRWLEATFECIVRNKAASLGCADLFNNKAFVPIFAVIGGCPNLFCGMQAVMYCISLDGDVDFWWVKPDKNGSLERQTLNRHGKGLHKNDPGRSKPFYKPLADLFSGQAKSTKPGTAFGIERINNGAELGAKNFRAYVDQETRGTTERLYIYCVWQEDWTANPLAWSKYIKGKILYQKDPQSTEYFSRQYNIANAQLTLGEREDPVFTDLLPGDWLKELRDPD